MDRLVNRRRVLVGLLGAAVAAVAPTAMFRHATAPAVQNVALAFGCIPGETHVYAFTYESEGALTDPSFGLGATPTAASAEQRVRAKIDGKLTATCVARGAEEHTLAMTFGAPVGALVLPDGTEQHAPELLPGTTFVTRSVRGQTKAIRFAAAMPETGRGIVRDMLALGQVTLPSAPARAWSSEERDPSGPFEVDYKVNDVAGDDVALTKTRRAPPDRGQLRAQALRPRAELTGGSAGGLVHVHHDGDGTDFVSDVDVTVALALKVGAKMVGDTRGHFALRHREQMVVDAKELARLDGELAATQGVASSWSDLAASDRGALLERRMQEDELGGDSWKTLETRLDASATDRTKVYLKLKALFLLHPEACAEATRELVMTEDTHSTRFHLLAGALTAAGTKEAQHALVAATRASIGKVAHERALVGSLGMLKTPTHETITELANLRDSHALDEIRGSARLALGSLARADPTQAKRTVESEVDAYRHAKTGNERALALLTLGNIGTPDVLALAREALEDPSPEVRAAAASSLRFVTEAGAEDTLVSVAQKDSSSAVRAEALRSLGYRILGAPGIDAVAGIVRADPEEDVRMAAVQVLAKEIGRDGALEAVLEEVVRLEHAAGVRNAAQFALMRYRATAAK